MPIQFYQILHVFGAFMIMLAYGGLIVRSALKQDSPGVRRMGAITSGIGLLLMLVSGFALLHKLQYGFPAWAIFKMVLWAVLGGLIVFINRKPEQAQSLWYTTLLLGLVATLLVYLKPAL